MRSPITNKKQMYEKLQTGQLGNCCSQWLTVADWLGSEDYHKYKFWGVRSQTPGGPCRLFCPRDEVAATSEGFGCPVNISPMIESFATPLLWADVYETATGLMVYGIEYPPADTNWRAAMPSRGQEYRGLAANLLLRRHLWPSSQEDVRELLDLYPGHVIEISAFDRAVGQLPHRNYVTWEVRQY